MSKCPICGIPSLHLTDHECQEPTDGGSDQHLVRQLWADGLQMENMKLKIEIAAVKSKLAEVVSIARQGRYSAVDFVAVGKRLDAMDDYLANS